MNKDKLVRLFEESFGTVGVRNLLSVHAPGRSEIAGNHTDHEGGRVIAAALDVAVDCIAANNGTATVRVASEGYPQIEVDLDSLDSRDDEKGSTAALVRGMAYEVAVRGGTPTGFDLAMTSTIPSDGGLSSSAAVEAALGRALEAFWGLEPASPYRARAGEPAHREQLLRQALRAHGPSRGMPRRPCVHGLRKRP